MFISVPERDSLNAQCLLCLPWAVVDLVPSDANVVILVPEIVRRVERGQEGYVASLHLHILIRVVGIHNRCVDPERPCANIKGPGGTLICDRY